MASKQLKTLRFNKNDNVAVAVESLIAGDFVEDGAFTAKENISAGHKIAVCDIKTETAVYKYGQIIGLASRDIATGQHVHDHNVLGDFTRDYAIGMSVRLTDYIPETERARFEGITRPDGHVATRNFIGVLSTVSCSSSVARFIANEMRDEIINAYPLVDGIVAWDTAPDAASPPKAKGIFFFI